MMIGELEFDDTFIKTISKNTTATKVPQNPFPEAAFVMLSFFMLLMGIILMNLLVCCRLERFISLIYAGFWAISLNECATTPCYCLKKFAPFCYPIRSKTKTIRDSLPALCVNHKYLLDRAFIGWKIYFWFKVWKPVLFLLFLLFEIMIMNMRKRKQYFLFCNWKTCH